MRRYDCLKVIAPLIGESLVVTNLANTATEWRSIRPHEGNLYFAGMGMVTPYAVGIAMALPNRRVLALDGDGGMLFDTSVLGIIGQTAPPNLCVLVLDNESYASTGKWPSTASLTAGVTDIEALARASGIPGACTVQSPDALVAAIEGAYRGAQPSLIVAKVDREQVFVGPTPMDSKENKYRFVRHIEQSENRIIRGRVPRRRWRPGVLCGIGRHDGAAARCDTRELSDRASDGRIKAGHPQWLAVDGFRHAPLCGRTELRPHPVTLSRPRIRTYLSPSGCA
jgi:hypothetical protein